MKSHPFKKFYKKIIEDRSLVWNLKKASIAFIICSICLMSFFMNCSLDEGFNPDLSVQRTSLPDLSNIVNSLASSRLNDLNNACSDNAFLDAVLTQLRASTPHGWRFGYFCINNDCKNISSYQVAFYEEASESPSVPPRSSAIAVKILNGVEPCTSSPSVTWEADGTTGGWVFPRPTSNTSCTGNHCTQSGNECENGFHKKTGLACGNSSGQCVDGINQVTGEECGSRQSTHVNNFHNGFQFSDIRWLHANMSDWQKTADITEVEFRKNSEGNYNGQICIRHTSTNTWTPKEVQLSSSDQRLLGVSSGTYKGNVSVIMKISDRYYGGTFEWLKSDDDCILGDVSSLAEAYASESKSIGKRVGKAPLDTIALNPGDIIGLMISGLGRNNVRNEQERSNIYWMIIPSANDDISPQHIPTPTNCNDSPDSLLCQRPDNCYVSGYPSTVIDNLATANVTSLRNACQPDNWVFMDLVAVRLEYTSPRHGYNCKGGNCNTISETEVTYFCDEGEPNSTSDKVRIFNVLAGCPNNAHVEWEDAEGPGRWKFPRIDPPTPGDGDGTCTAEQITDGWQATTIGGETVCAASCTRKSLPEPLPMFNTVVELGINAAQCSTTQDPPYNILPVTAPLYDADTCCRRTPKSCSQAAINLGYGTVNGECYPSCHLAARFAGYEGTQVSLSQINSDCSSLRAHNQNDWTTVDFYDPYTFKRNRNTKTDFYHPQKSGTNLECCVRGDTNTTPVEPPNNQGLYGTNSTPPLAIPPGTCPETWMEHATGTDCNIEDTNITNDYNIHSDLGGGCCRTRKGSSLSCPTDYESTNGNCYPTCATAVALSGGGTGRIFAINDDQGSCVDAVSSSGEDDWTDFSFWNEYQMQWAEDNTKIKGVIDQTSTMCCRRGDATGTRKLDPWGDHSDTNTDVDRGLGAICRSLIAGVDIPTGGEMKTGSACEHGSYNILLFDTDTAESKCCIRTPKAPASCPSGYGRKNGECYPTCAEAAKLAGYTRISGYADTYEGEYVDKKSDCFIGLGCCEDDKIQVTTCAGLNEVDEECNDGGDSGFNKITKWDDFSFWDPYRFKQSSNDDTVNDGLCCVNTTSGQQNGPIARPPCGSQPAENVTCEEPTTPSGGTGGGGGSSGGGGGSGDNHPGSGGDDGCGEGGCTGGER